MANPHKIIDIGDHRYEHKRVEARGDKSYKTHLSFAHSSNNAYSYSSGGGGDMENYITRPEFEEHKRHLDSRFDGISKDITIAKDQILSKIAQDKKEEDKEREKDRKESEKERKSDRKWFIGLTVATSMSLLGIILQAFNVI